MKNFSVSNLILVNPLEKHLDTYAMGFACKAKDILQNARVIRSDFELQLDAIKELFHEFDIVVGTSAKGFSFQNIKRIPVFLADFNLSTLSEKTKIALVFGRESTGLSNEQIFLTDFLVKIPANPKYPTLNLSHAVGIILYDLYQKMYAIEREQVITASKEQKDQLLAMIEEVIQQTPVQEFRSTRTLFAFQNLIGRAFLSRKEYSYLYTFFRKLNLGINNPDLFTANGLEKV
jgi:TrmH family RNA methyltransferase